MNRPLIAAAGIVAVLCSLTACAPSADAQDKKACQEWSSVITDWTNAGGGELAAQGAAGKLSSQVIPDASQELASSMRIVTKAIDSYSETSTPEQSAASRTMGARCKAVGAPLNSDG